MNDRDRNRDRDRDRENKVVCKTLPINYKIPTGPPPPVPLPSSSFLACCICMRLLKVITKLLKPCRTPTPTATATPSSIAYGGIPGHKSSPAMKSSRCRCRNRNPKRISSCLFTLLSPLLSGLACTAEFAVIGKGQQGRQQGQGTGGRGRRLSGG